MPRRGESATEGSGDNCLKPEGEFVKREEPLVEVVTDKVNAEIPSPFEGKLVKISAGEGETVRVGAVIGQIEVAGAGTAANPVRRLAWRRPRFRPHRRSSRRRPFPRFPPGVTRATGSAPSCPRPRA